MPTTIIHWDDKSYDREIFYDLYKGIFLDGECYAFAIAQHEALGWPLVGVMQGKVIRHAGVRSPEGTIFDVRGFISDTEFANHFGIPASAVQPIEKEQLYATRPIGATSIQRAREVAEILWPHLPWKESRLAKARAFADELEALSRKYGFWITGSVSVQPAVLRSEFGAEAGYELGHTIDGNAFTINRRLLSKGEEK